LGGATASGTIGGNTITTSADVSAQLEVGARIRLGAAGSITSADTLGSDTYTITGIAGTTITTQESLTATYAGDMLRRGVVSEWQDKAAGNHATQGTAGRMPLWVSSSNDFNNQGSIRFFNADRTHLNLTPDLNNTAGEFNSVFFTMNWTGSDNQMPFGFNSYDLWVANGNNNRFGFNGGSSLNYGMDPTPLLENSTHQLSAYFYNGSIVGNSYLFIDSDPQSLTHFQGTNSSKTVSDNMRISSWTSNLDYTFDGQLSEIVIMDTDIADIPRQILEQYQSAKWGIELTPPGTGMDEAARAMASDGYSVFTSGYLESLSETADIVLQAGNSITLDLQGDTLRLDNNRSLTLKTGSGDIRTASAGAIITRRNGSGGNITFNAGRNININHALSLDAQNNGVITFLSGNTSTGLNENLTILNGIRSGDLFTELPSIVLKESGDLSAAGIALTEETRIKLRSDDEDSEAGPSNISSDVDSEESDQSIDSNCLASFASGECVLSL